MNWARGINATKKNRPQQTTMKLANIHDELLAIISEYKYGIAPGSTRVTSIDETRGTGQVELELLEGAVVVVEVSDRGFQVR